jgi:hypothetical protein
MTFFNDFIRQVNKFFRENWWISIIYLVMLMLIYLDHAGDFVPIALVSSLHFIADIFIMMMFTAYDQKNYKSAGYLQIASLLIFLSIKVYTGVAQKGWFYILADPIYILAAIKGYYLPVKNIDLRFINAKTTAILSIFLLLCFRIFSQGQIDIALQQWVLTFGLYIFAIALCTQSDSRLQYILSVAGLATMISGSALVAIYDWKKGDVTGLSISYMLLPLTVLIYRLKNWRSSFLKPVSSLPHATHTSAV